MQPGNFSGQTCGHTRRRRIAHSGRAIGFIALIALALAARAADRPAAKAAVVVPPHRQADHVAVLTINGEIDRITFKSLERRIELAQRHGATAITLDIDTPGGSLYDTLDICQLLKDRNRTPAYTVAWINPNAYSAGSIIALACNETVVSSTARMGDAAPIMVAPVLGLVALPDSERAKMEAPILTEVIDSARRNHYDERLVQAFISVGVELWMLENIKTGEHVIVDREEYRTVFGEEPPAEITSLAIPEKLKQQGVQPRFSLPDLTGRQQHADAEPLSREEIAEQIQQAQTLPPSRGLLTAADRGDWTVVRQVISNERLLNVTADEARYYGIATAPIDTDEELKAYFGAKTLTRYDRSWSESLVRFLTSPLIMGLLIAVFLICLFIELAVPGVGVFGLTAAIALVILIGAPALAGMAQWWEILLIIVGLLLVAAEVFIIPGFGVAGISGILCLLVGLVGMFVSDELPFRQAQDDMVLGFGVTMASLFVAGVSIWIISRQIQTLPFLNRVVLKAELSPATAGGSGLLEAMQASQGALAPGDIGVAVTDLRRSGRAEFEGRLVDVQSVGSYIDKGSSVRVVTVGRFAIEVEEIS